MSSKPNIVILGDYEASLRKFSDWRFLDEHANITIYHEHLANEALFEVTKDADAIVIVRDRAPINAQMIARLPKLKFVMFTGERNSALDITALQSRNIPVACTAGGPSKTTTAELTWALILSASKRLIEQNELIKVGGWRNHLSLLPMLEGERLGIIGLGAIGSKVARVGKAFGMEIVTWSPNMTQERASLENAKFISLEELLKTSKVVSLHLVLGPGTKDLINEDQLLMMRPDSILVNTSRSSLINMNDLQQSLLKGTPGQAAIDVFDMEPLPKNDALRNTPNLLATPHLGFIAEPVFSTFSDGITENLQAWIRGVQIPHLFK